MLLHCIEKSAKPSYEYYTNGDIGVRGMDVRIRKTICVIGEVSLSPCWSASELSHVVAAGAGPPSDGAEWFIEYCSSNSSFVEYCGSNSLFVTAPKIDGSLHRLDSVNDDIHTSRKVIGLMLHESICIRCGHWYKRLTAIRKTIRVIGEVSLSPCWSASELSHVVAAGAGPPSDGEWC